MRYLFVILVIFPLFLSAQIDEFTDGLEENYEFKNKVYNPYIRAIDLFQFPDRNSDPIIYLNTGNQLMLEFDDLEMEIHDINYMIFHCDAKWNKSDIDFYRYAEGVEEGYFTEYDYSRAMNQRYIHYQLKFPNQDIKLTASGNYVIVVYRDNNPKDLILSRRFHIVENRVNVSMDIHRAFDPEFRFSKQEVDFEIDYSRFQLVNPAQYVKVALLQNNRWDNAKTELKPNFVGDSKLTYNYEEENTFWAGNEYRYINISNFDLRSINVEGIIKRPDTTYYFVEKAKPKIQHELIDRTNNRFGAQEFRVSNSSNTTVDPDYAEVFFYVLADYPDHTGDYYVYGELSNYEHSPQYKMQYNEEKKRYQVNLYLKQGTYNWHFHFLPDNDSKADLRPVEGSFSETLNRYTLFVYYRGVTDDYDRIIGIRTQVFPTLSSE